MGASASKAVDSSKKVQTNCWSTEQDMSVIAKVTMKQELVTMLVEPKFACKCKVEFEDIPGVGRLVGHVPMFSHEMRLCLDNAEKAEAMLRELVMEAKLRVPVARLEGDNGWIRVATRWAMLVVPEQDPTCNGVLLLSSLACALLIADDDMGIEDFESPTINEIEFLAVSYAETIVRIFQGEYTSFEAVPPLLPSLVPMARFFWLITQRFGPVVPSGIEGQHMVKASEDSFNLMALFRVPDLALGCSEELYRRLRVGDAGAAMIFKMFPVLVKGCPVRPEVRNHIVMRQLLDMMIEESFLSNDLVSFGKEMMAKKPYRNYVLRGMEVEKLSLAESFAKLVELVGRLRRDIILLSNQLLLEFPDEEGLAEFVAISKFACDSSIYLVREIPRYVGVTVNEVQDESP